jgi:hypothetical protein
MTEPHSIYIPLKQYCTQQLNTQQTNNPYSIYNPILYTYHSNSTVHNNSIHNKQTIHNLESTKTTTQEVFHVNSMQLNKLL